MDSKTDKDSTVSLEITLTKITKSKWEFKTQTIKK